MRFNLRILFFAVSLLAITLGILCQRASNQRIAVRQLLNHELVAIQFSNGDYCETVSAIGDRNHFFHTVNVVYLDVPRDEQIDLIPLLRRLPVLNRIILRYQGQDLDEHNRLEQEIDRSFRKQEQEIRDAFPNVEILKFSTTVESE